MLKQKEVDPPPAYIIVTDLEKTAEENLLHLLSRSSSQFKSYGSFL